MDQNRSEFLEVKIVTALTTMDKGSRANH